MSYWPPPPPSSASSSPPLSPHHQQQQQQEHEAAQHRFHYESSAQHQQTDTREYPIFSHTQQQQQQSHEHHAGGYTWSQQQQQQQHHHHPSLPAMTLDPLPILHSSGAELQRAPVSIEDEIFEARMLQEALRDCDTSTPTAAAPLHSASLHQQQQQLQPSSPPLYQPPQSFQAQLMFPPQFATVTPTNNALLRGSISQRNPSNQVVSPVENLRSLMLQHQHQHQISPSSYSSSSSNRSPVMGLASLQGSTPPASAAAAAARSFVTGAPSVDQGQPKKRVQTARICHVEGCTRGIRSRGLCKAHGGGRRCTTPGCTTSDQGGGHCVLHGGGRRCRVEGCVKSAQWRGVCKLHGGARRCRYGNCTKNGQVKQGYCRLHYNLLTQQRLQGLLLSGAGSGDSNEDQGEVKEEQEHKGDEEKPFTSTSLQQQRP